MPIDYAAARGSPLELTQQHSTIVGTSTGLIPREPSSLHVPLTPLSSIGAAFLTNIITM